jgi:hypothetical protein
VIYASKDLLEQHIISSADKKSHLHVALAAEDAGGGSYDLHRRFTIATNTLPDQSGRLRISDAGVLIGLQRRLVFRLLGGLKQDGPASLLSKRRGRPSNHRIPAEVRTLALSIVRERYADLGPTRAFAGAGVDG